MRNQVNLAIAAAAAAFLLSACADGLVTEAATDLPSLQTTQGETECVGALAGTFDNVLVPKGGECTLTNSIVRGNVKALRNSSLMMVNVQVDGSVQADRTFMVSIRLTTVEGNIEIRGPRAIDAGVVGVAIGSFEEEDGVIVKGGNIQIEKVQTGIISIINALVKKGNVQLVENVTDVLLQVEFNTVAQNVQVFKNTNTGIGQFVSQNTVAEQVQCLENIGAVFVGGPNITSKAEGQCF